MLLILTHEKSDFDAVASQLGARKLYPNGIPLLSRSLNRNVQQFLTLYWDALPFVRAEDWQKQRIDQVILVDTQGLNSVRGVVKHPKVRVIDHHTGHPKRPGWTYQVEPVGATTTLLVEHLQARGLTLTTEEATLLLLGIYEDTGTLTYDTSTARDVWAAGWLFQQGAQLDVVRRFLAIPLTPEQQELYDELQANAEWQRVHGQPIVIATAVAKPGFDAEISSIAHRLRETLTPAGLFVVVQLGQDVQVVARSANEYIDVSQVTKALGGGGHERAAAALVVRSTPAAVVDQIRRLLMNTVTPPASVSEIMSHGVQTISPDMPVSEAAQQMQRTGHEGYPVVEPETGLIQGLLTRNAVDRAVNLGLGDLPVSRVMKAGIVTVRPSESIERVQELMLNEGWGQIPVVADMAGPDGVISHPIGIVTRTDMLNYLFKPLPEGPDSDMRGMLEASLSPAMWAMVLAVSHEAAVLSMPLYFVGGLVRDVTLDIPATDLDMVVEGDAIQLARRLQVDFGGEVHTHKRFGTAKWFVTPEIWTAVVERYLEGDNHPLGQGLPESIDFVTARSEFYTEPSALPEVERGSIKLDLHRRDFTINTLAVRLDGAHLGELLDFYGGRRDLQRGLIRVLHSLSFIDDPTRILRAVRLEQRLEFEIEPRTLDLLISSLPMLDRVTGDRIRHEIELALTEALPVPMRTLERLQQLGVLEQIYVGLRWLPDAASAFERVPAFMHDSLWSQVYDPDDARFLYFAQWMMPLPTSVQRGTVSRLRARKTTREDLASLDLLLALLEDLPLDARPSMVERALRPFHMRVLLAARIYVDGDPVTQLLDDYHRSYRHVKTVLTGDDFRALGFKPGPQYAEWLDELLAARLDGRVTDAAGERALLEQLAARAERID